MWFDEIYVGFDNTMDFICPLITRQQINMMAPEQRGWGPEELNEEGVCGVV